LEKCRGCKYKSNSIDDSCERKYKKQEIYGTITRYTNRKDGWQLEINTNMLDLNIKRKDYKISSSERHLKEIFIESRDIEIIKKQKISNSIKELLIEKHRRIKENNVKQEELIFYTDGSLIKAKKGNQDPDSIGAGWVQVNNKEEYVIDEGAIGARGWPSSTKAELLAIWCVVTIVPSKSKIKIYTDSAAAIASIRSNTQHITTKKRMKRKNYNLVVNIEDTIRAKELDLELVKIKGHSDNRWNSRADSIAKKRANIQDRNEIIEEPVLRSNVTLFWKDKVVKNPT
jgi:ribonuclease HI